MILPAIVRECTVRFGHAMRVLPLLDRIAAIVRCIQQFTRQPSRHSGFTTRASGGDEPTNSQRLRAVRPHLNRNLIGGTTDTTAANLNTRLHIIESIMKELQRIRSDEHTSEHQSLMRSSY